jgi:nicotinamide mononucleotide transporter
MTAFCAWLTAHGTSCLELVAVLFGVVSVYLSTREKLASWPTALVNVALFFVLFYRTGLYSDMALQVVYFALSIYGWYQWQFGGANRSALAVTRTSPRLWAILAGVAIVTWLALAQITSRIPGAAVPYMDALTVSVSLVAQWMMTRKLLENWVVWLVVDVVYVGMLIYKHLYLTAGNYFIYLVLAGMGYVAWRRSFKETEHSIARSNGRST